jgi:hypothetical protein
MTAPALHRRLQAAAALLAVALLALAVPRSVVMQAEAATPWGAAPICGLRDGSGSDPDPRHTAQAACAFCAAAAESPIQRLAEPVRRPSWIGWTPGPTPVPAVAAPPIPPTPRARGPPRPSDLSV